MYETFPKKNHHKKFGSGSMPSGPGGTSYPGQRLPTTANDAGTNTVSQKGNGMSAPGKDYKKGKCGCDSFPGLNGLPS